MSSKSSGWSTKLMSVVLITNSGVEA